MFGVPVEEGGEVGGEVEGYVGVFFAFGGGVVGAAFGAVRVVRRVDDGGFGRLGALHFDVLELEGCGGGLGA